MGRKRIPGIYKKGSHWQIDKKIFGYRLCESTGTGDLEEAEKYLARRIDEIRQATVYGVRPKRSFMEAATKFLMENQHKRSIDDDAGRLREVVKYIGDLSLESIHIGSLQLFIEGRRKDGVSTRTINHGLKVVRRILNLAASEWMDEFGLTWLANAPKIKLLPEHDLRKPYPLNWDEQHRLFDELPSHLEKMALFAVNTGCRDQEICELRWEWEIKIPEMPHIMVFIIPAELVKNGEERLVVCNETARSVVNSERGKHLTHVFSFKGRPLVRILSTGWRNARVKAELPHVRVHDLKHTFGRRLRAAGVSFEDRQDLLGHRSGRITTHYSSAELQNLFEAANRVCEKQKSGVVLTLLRNTNFKTRKVANESVSAISL
ncbi:TPA: site-specific integrase [Legionella pneumophila]|uniref:Integrase n=2 Tax=Legionella pneumophila TaxID=446 RepID=A0A378KFF6_LEGPN|nr:site-specific integrase [Legionella pneumophila]CZI28373.1 site-specific tyrosine recombinase XerC [Legionella pneumophila]CZI97732.1 site-specific tyrosine recombinase XerC [Legionella pneumophila]CZJ15511.1 site-specific tyrosine recombinase XerC [Legionella pneumophila]CZP20203.1 site-specific tyrosine recombinase XerC [Legionella pneumophila]CZP67266.1 site-specific tyrosine recombinase XerC [Legionella pneumophila]